MQDLLTSRPLTPGKYEIWHQWKKVVFGVGVLEQLPGELDRLGRLRAFIITTRSLVRERVLLEQVQSVLGDRFVGMFGESDQHVPRSTVLRAAEAAQAANADVLVSFGGSSVVDTAKGLAMALSEGIATESDFDRYRIVFHYPGNLVALPFKHTPIPHIALPTTLSAAEYTAVIGITDQATGSKDLYSDDSLAPATIILDPVLTSATPDRLWLATGVKTLGDAIEQLYSKASSPVVDALALRSIEWFMSYLPQSVQGYMDARLRCQVAAWMSLFGTFNAGTSVGIGAGLRHQLGAMFGMPHGEATCVMLPHVLRYNLPAALDRQVELARAVGVELLDFSDEQLGEAVIQQMTQFIQELGLPSRLKPFGVHREDFPKIAGHVLADFVTLTNPRTVKTVDELIELLEKAL